MNLHEHQAKELLKKYGAKIQEGIAVESVQDAVNAGKALTEQTGTQWYVVKAQVHAGGRGKGGGVKLAKNAEELKEKASAILGMKLVTPQTGEQGKIVNRILIAEDVYYGEQEKIKEFYVSILLDRTTKKNVIIYSTEGGMEIEEVAESHPEKVHKEYIDPLIGIQGYQCRRIAFNLGLEGNAFKEMVKFVENIYNAYVGADATLVEINPCLKTSDDKIIAVDGKISIDDNALYRQAELAAKEDKRELDPTEVEAVSYDLNYVKLDGNVGCMVNGAGLAMATMDIIKLSGGDPANFLDVGGTANAERVEKAFRIILQDSNVKAILINIFGGIVRCDRVAQGVVDAYKSIGNIPVPIIVRLQGTNAVEGKRIIDESGLKVKSAILLREAAEAVKEVLN
ncbi:MAG: ADP-forming succinate--CoA ligase subunit beta [Chitinophagales bacterium]|nr:ADP-forming succinate--CoA ligase subunit beta [Chitinophagales bacterium]